MASTAAELAQVIPIIRDLTATKYTTISATTIMLYDMILQFPDEYRLVWKAKFNALKYAYAINRYLVLGVLCFFSYGLTAPAQDLNDKKVINIRIIDYPVNAHDLPFYCRCRVTPVILGSFGVASVAISNALVYIRVLVLWRRALSIKIALFTGYIICYIFSLTFIILTMRQLQVAANFNPVIGSCILPVEAKYFIGFWAPNMALDIYAFFLVLMSLRNRPIGLDSSKLRFIYYDAIQYSVVIAALKLGMIIVLSVGIVALDFVIFGIEWSLVVTVGARFLMKLYSIGHKEEDDETTLVDSYPLIHLNSNKEESIHARSYNTYNPTASSGDNDTFVDY